MQIQDCPESVYGIEIIVYDANDLKRGIIDSPAYAGDELPEAIGVMF